MRHSNFAKAFGIAPVALALLFVPSSKAGQGCTVGSLYGTFADKDLGFIIPGPNAAPIPFAGVNLITFDGSGNMTATGFGNVGGSGAAQTEVGTYTVNPDCTGTYTVTVNPGTQGAFLAHAFFVIDDSLNELQIIVTDPGGVVTCVARRQFPVGR